MSFASVNHTSYDNTHFSQFCLTPEELEIKQKEIEPMQNAYRIALDKYVEDNNLVKLRSDYFGIDMYFFSHSQNKMYKVSPNWDRIFSPTPNFHEINDPHILSINNLTNTDNNNLSYP